MVRAHLIVRGGVQGVFFRACTRDEAERLGVTGWVRNRPEGTVEVLLEGVEEEVDRIVEWCRQGPPIARVDEVSVEMASYRGEFGSFRIIR